MKRQFTASAYIIENQQVLLIFHRKLQKWLPPGGHLEPQELPHEGAIREAFEETGLRIELIPQENITVERWNARTFPRPYLCMLQEIPPLRDEPAHQHVDFCYLGRPIGGRLQQNYVETGGLRWFSLDEIEAMQGDHDIFEETRQVIRSFLKNETIKAVI